LIEWWVAVLSGTQAEAFLGTQGDIWDTQWDMCLALIGALVAQISLAKYHHRSMSVLE
jgi:putative membrane protein